MQIESAKNPLDELNPRTATLRDSELEKRFQFSQALAYRTPLSIIATLIFIVDIWSLILEINTPGVLSPDSLVMWIRIFAIFLGPTFIYLNHVLVRPESLSSIFEIYLSLIIFLTLSTLYAHPDYDFIAPITLVCIIFGIYSLAPFSWLKLLVYALVFTIFGGFAFLATSSNSVDVARLSEWLFVAHGLGIVTSWLRNMQLRELFLARQNLQLRWQHEAKYRMRNYALADLLTHELRNPLAAIGAQAELIERLSEDKVRQLAEKIGASVYDANALIRDWTDSDKLGYDLNPSESQGQPIDVVRLVKRLVLEQNRSEQSARIKLDLRCGRKVLARVDPRVLSLALSNLIENGVKYSKSNSSSGDHPSLIVSVRCFERLVIIRVRDFGIGILPSNYEKVFSKHQRVALTSAVNGSGVGLFLCRSLMQLEGGDIRFVSRVGLGSAFSISIPASD